MLEITKNIIFFIFPFIKCIMVNRIFSKQEKTLLEEFDKNPNFISPYMEKFNGISSENANYIVKNISEARKSLEEKAKITVVAVTVSVSLLSGIAGYLINMKDKILDNSYFNFTIAIFTFFSISYLIVGGIFSLLALNSKKIYDFAPDDFKYLKDYKGKYAEQEKVLLISRNCDLNGIVNFKLNNLVSCSNQSIINALSILTLVVIVICFSFIYSIKSTDIKQNQGLFENQQNIKELREIELNQNDMLDKMKNRLDVLQSTYSSQK